MVSFLYRLIQPLKTSQKAQQEGINAVKTKGSIFKQQ